MKPWTSKKLSELLKAELFGDSTVEVGGCSLDSRQVQAGQIFFALSGERVDGHQFITIAWDKGAAAVIAESAKVEEELKKKIPPGKALILVDSSIKALQQLAKAWRLELGAKVIGITGSNGKTTTKDMIASVLAERYDVYKNSNNHNNELGLPLTILNAPPDTELLVLEMGMRGLGEIKELCAIALPDTGVITNIGTTHLELLGTQERIAQAKWELIKALPPQGTAIINAEDEWSLKKVQTDFHSICYYGLGEKTKNPDLLASDIQPLGTMQTTFRVRGKDGEEAQAVLPLPGEHNVLDALAALAVGSLYNISLAEGCKGLSKFELSKMRLEIKPGIFESVLISDVYNANPVSMQASLKILQERAGSKNRLAILGEMYELGQAARLGHREVGECAARLGITELITVGELARHIADGAREGGFPTGKIHICATREEAVNVAKEVLERLQPEPWVLIKGSRGMRMEEIVNSLLE